MKILSYTILLFLFIFSSCSSDDEKTTANELDRLEKVHEMINETHVVELYSETGVLKQGYNEVSMRIKDKTSGEYVNDAQITWLPIMQMSMMSHSCPFSEVQKTPGRVSLYNGFVIFQMAQNETEYWHITVNYTIDGTEYSVTDQINVLASDYQRVISFLGADDNRYVVALIAPKNPKVASNDMTAAVYKMTDMMHFTIVDDFTLIIDPRMPGMGNHGSPNNVDLTQSGSDDLYHGKLSLTMTGYWKINLQLLDASGSTIKGEVVTDENPASSIYFETEF